MNQHLKTAVVLSRQRTRSLYTAAPSGITHYPPVVFDYSPRPSPRKVPVQNSHEQPSASPATTLPTPYGPLPFPGGPWLTHSAPTYGVPPPLWLCPPLDTVWFPLALGIDVGPGPWDLVRKQPKPQPEEEPVPEPASVPWSFECGAFGIPKRAKRRLVTDEELSLAVQVGEDSYFVRPDALGVADGVGGWAHHANVHADSARFARMLMHNCASEIANPTNPSDAYPSPPLTPSPSNTDVSQLAEALSSVSLSPDVCPKEILQMAYERTVATFRATGTAGSSTALVAVLRDGELSVAHLGDCMLAVVRDGKFVVRSEDMQHSFNFPYQLGPHSSTSPRADAQLIREKVVPGDIVILASDGLGDNLWDEEVLAEVERFVQEDGKSGEGVAEGVGAGEKGVGGEKESVGEKRLGNPQILGEALARRAKKAAEGTRDVPFGVRGRAAGIQFMGGKTDDISVVVAVVRGPSSTPAPSSTTPSSS